MFIVVFKTRMKGKNATALLKSDAAMCFDFILWKIAT